MAQLLDILQPEFAAREILEARPIGGGDISSVYKVSTRRGKFLCKVNFSADAYDMFTTEKYALDLIGKTGTVAIPVIAVCKKINEGALLLMEYIESKSPNSSDFERLGESLARLHLVSGNSFGLDRDNFIGSLNQSNKEYENWAEFYFYERITPQIEMATLAGYLPGGAISEKLLNTFKELFRGVRPSLLHGDLWSGNYLIAENGKPYLIDPASYYGHSEVDIAMTRLFGGFAQSFYEAYHKIIPLDEKSNLRIEIYQLYYLLVHLNLFGIPYLSQVKRILNKLS